jgi:NADP-dependent 3-hydroxy acid dehydrogenase YdfG
VDSLAGRTAIVTGASQGIGAEIARQLSRAGARVALAARRKAELDKLVAKLDAANVAIECDVTDRGSVAAAAAAVRAAFGGAPDIIVNNAGVFRVATLDKMEPQNFLASISTNLIGPFFMLHEFLPEMRRRGSGHIVSIGSAGDRNIFAENGAYSAAKFGLRAMHEVLRKELRGSGVRSTIISPSSVDTALWEGLDTESERSKYGSRSKMLNPGDIARAIVFVLSQPATVNVDELRLSRT